MQNTNSHAMEQHTMKTQTNEKHITFFIGSPNNVIVVRPTQPVFERANTKKPVEISNNNFNIKSYLETIYEIHTECET